MSLPLDRTAGQFQLDLNAERRREFLQQCNTRLQAARQSQLDHVRDVPGRRSANALSDLVDVILGDIHAWLISEARLTANDYQRISLVAQGGYGRAQLNPHSDIDLLFILPDNPRPIEQAFVKSYLYMLWDLNKVELGHATKKISEAVEAVGLDLDSTTALLSLRLVAGNQDPMLELSRRVQAVVRGGSRRWFIEAKLAESKVRREKFGSSIYLLEPNVKEGEGGLRDVHSLQWLSYVLLGDDRLEVLTEKQVLTSDELGAIHDAVDFLLNVRTCLHHAEGRKIDSLSFDKQPIVAQALGYESDPQLLAEEKLMKDYYLHARNIDRFSQKATRSLTMRNRVNIGGMFRAVRRRSVGKHYYARGGELFLKDPNSTIFADVPECVMECFCLAATNQVSLSDELKGTIEQARSFCDREEFRNSPVCLTNFMQIMAQKRCCAQTMHAMHDTGILAAYMPEFKRLFCLVRIDHYHRYTVDEHLIKTLEISEELVNATTDVRHELSHVARSIKRWDLLNLSLLLHDIGKGEGHGHVLRGAIVSQKMTQRMGLPPADQEIVRLLILYHLKMVHISQRRDLEDTHVIAEMAGTTPDPELLSMLYVLTYCDTRAVGPNAWTDWKGSLLYDLYRKTLLLLQGKDPLAPINATAIDRIRTKLVANIGEAHEHAIDQFLANAPTKYLTSVTPTRMARHFKLLESLSPEERIAWHVDEPEHLNYTEITVVAQDVKGLLSWVCGALSSKDINILSLQAFSTKDGYAIDVFQVTDLRGNKLPHGFRMDRLRTVLNEVILGRKQFSEAFPLRRKSRIQGPDVAMVKPVQIILDNDGSPNYTILEVKAYDRPGLLYDVTSICSEQGYYIHLAMITTEAYRVVDVFYITDLEFTKLDTNRIKKLREALEQAVA